ncbi:MAG TPA: 50S ribosomal protein L3 [Candidatus Paceibacterota bacterium]|nr:50S ribosomal protein L3 [Candidatus Paceibacterota bacterium]
MKIILGTKEKMSQIFGEDGKVYPVTIINAGPVFVTQIKNKDKDGYESVQVGFGEKKAHNINKARMGHFKGLGNFRYLKEFKISPVDGVGVGTKIDASAFSAGDKINVASFSKGKGFQGVVKRHGFAGGPRTHGQKHSEREPGSIGGRGRAGGRVSLGMRMGGRMGGDRVTIKNIEVIQVNPEENQIIVKGGVPGRRGTLVEIMQSGK